MPTHRVEDIRKVCEDNGIELESEPKMDKMEDGRMTPPNDSRDEKER